MGTAPSGRYPIERREGEIERLDIQSEAMRPDAEALLGLIGVAEGWRCLDLGCGPGGIVELLSRRVGASGRVTGFDGDPAFLEHARAQARSRGLANVEFVQGDAYRTGLPRASYDLVHIRFVASTVGSPRELIAEAAALARPGSTIALQEADIETLRCYPPLPAWDRLVRTMEALFERSGGDVRLGPKLFGLLRGARLEAVRYRPFIVGFGAGDAMVDFLPATIESMRKAILQYRLMPEPELDAALRECRAHLADPGTVFTYPTVTQAWGRKPER